MLKKYFFFGVIAALAVSCNTKFSVNGEYEETPVVHFLLDQGKDYQFMKLNKTFLEEGNANEFAKDAEYSYFDNVEATVTEYVDNIETREWTLQDTVIQNKKDGVFYGPEQKLYFFKVDASNSAEKLNEDAVYQLNVNIDNGVHTVTGETSLVKGVSISYPQTNQSLNFAENDVANNGYRSTPITFSKSNSAPIYKLQMRFDYREYTSSSNEVKSILWNIGESDNASATSTSATISASGQQFYEFISANITSNEDVVKRDVDGFELILTAGSDDLYTYMLTNEPTSSLAQNQPTYSNVDGALGIFSSRLTFTQYKASYTPPFTRALNQNSTRELCNGQFTNTLKFCSPIPGDNTTSFACN